MPKIVVSTWMSLDGVFDAGNMNEWFTPFDSEGRQGYIKEGILACDAFLFGRKTYEMLAPYWSALKNNEMGVAAKLNSAPKYVVSSTLEKVGWENAILIKNDIREEIARLKEQPGTEIQIEGSATLVESLAKWELIDEYRLLVHPIIMGNGNHFFKDGMHAKGMKLVKTKTLDHGVTLLCYQTENR
ncbi:dihydrofolate reductase family protein [Flavitalea flava]